jgi:asparagine synthase (glutamine-hydrolysing)
MGQRAYSPLKKRISRSVIEHNRSTQIKDIASELEKRIIKSIELHLQSDAPIAALCSGGIDSSLISAIAKKINPHLELYHAGVYGKGGEEKFARMMEDHLNCKVNYTYVKQDEFLRELPFITYISDLPIYHPNDASLSILAKKIKTDGIKVLLSGEGADELFGGYSWHHRLINREKTISNIERFPKVKNALARVIAKLPFDECLNIRAEEFREFYAAGIGKSYSGSYTMAKACQFTVMQYSKWKRWQECKTAYDCLDNQQEAFGLSLIFSDLFDHLGTILHRTDRILMAHSIEGRVPFLENNIMDLALNLPLNCKVNGRNGKHILKIVAEKYLPSSVIYRPKMGFPVPWQKYIENVGVIFENGYVQKLTGLETNDLCSFYKNDPTLKWRMLALEIWGRIFERNEKWQDIKIN